MHPVSLRLPIPASTFHLNEAEQLKAVSIIYSNRNMPVLETALPASSILRAQQEVNATTSYVTVLNDPNHNIEATDLINTFYEALPFLLRFLLRYNPEEKDRAINKDFDRVEELQNTTSRLQLAYQSRNEVVLSANYRYFCLHFSLLLHRPRKYAAQSNLVLTTAITFNHKIAALYLEPLTWVLKKIAPAMLKQLTGATQKERISNLQPVTKRYGLLKKFKNQNY